MTEQPSDVRPETARKILETAVAGSTFVRTSSNSKNSILDGQVIILLKYIDLCPKPTD